MNMFIRMALSLILCVSLGVLALVAVLQAELADQLVPLGHADLGQGLHEEDPLARLDQAPDLALLQRHELQRRVRHVPVQHDVQRPELGDDRLHRDTTDRAGLLPVVPVGDEQLGE